MITLADFLLGLGNLHGLVFSFSDFVCAFIQKKIRNIALGDERAYK